MSAEVAATLWAAVDERVSFLTVAIPRFAGKSTTSYAVLDLRPPEMPTQHYAGERDVLARLRHEPGQGYVVVEEFSQAPVPGYIWGEPVRRLFETISETGHALQASLHAPGVHEAVREVTLGNRVPDEHASLIRLVMYIERFGTDLPDFWRRISELYEIDRVEGGKAVGRTLFRWQPADDTYARVEEPRHFAGDKAVLAARTGLLAELAASGRTSEADVRAAVADFRAKYGAPA